MDKTALVAGATGLVGSTLLEYLLNGKYYQKVMVLTRRPLVCQPSEAGGNHYRF